MKNYLDYKGRLNRKRYFFRGCLLAIPFMLATDLPKAYGIILPGPVSIVGLLVAIAAVFVAFIQAIARLHDLDKSGWYSLFLLLPLVNFFYGVYLTLQRGTTGPNRFGPDPLQQPDANGL